MTARFYKPTDIIEVRVIPLLIYGGPGVGKTSLTQTADKPVTLDFNTGIHRSFNRKETWQFDSWDDVIEEQKKGLVRDYNTVIVDTGGNLLECMMKSIMHENAKFTQLGGLSQMGWGQLGRRFATWLANLLSEGKSVVFICHEEDDKKADGERFVRPSLPGRMAYDIMHQNFDLMGHLYYEGDKRFLNFNPSEKRIAKNSAGFKIRQIEQLEDTPTLLGDMLAEAKKKVGMTAEQSAAIARTVAEWRQWLELAKLEELNERLGTDFAALDKVRKRQVWAMMLDYTKECGIIFDGTNKKFVPDPIANKKFVPDPIAKPAAVSVPAEPPEGPPEGPTEGGAAAASSPDSSEPAAAPSAEQGAPAHTEKPAAEEKPKRAKKEKAAQEGAAP
jgi:hypothetical protein